MKRIFGEEVKQYQLEILDYVAQFCENNGIRYWLDSGTLLGAIRHNGYIPWDDDIDIGMLRDDYNKFMRLFNENNSKFKFYSFENNSEFPYPHGKVLNTDTVLYEPDKNGNKLCINIDIFIYDNAPDDNRVVEKMYRKRDFLYRLRSLQLYRSESKSNVKQLVCRILHSILQLFPKCFFVKYMVKNTRRFVGTETTRVGDFTGFTRIVCSKEIFREFAECKFEGKSYKIPIGYDEWLRAFYGDYMQLPPIEERVSHHKYEAYIEA